MISSMIGFGRGQAQSANASVSIELRSVNSRYCEVSARLPRQLAEYETRIQNLIKQSITRGRINIQLQLESSVEEGLAVTLNQSAVRGYVQLLNTLKETSGIDEPITLSHLLSFPNVVSSIEESTETSEDLWNAIEAAMQKAIASLKNMRQQEGQALQKDLELRLDAIEKGLKDVEQRAPERVTESRNRLQERLLEIIEDDRIDRDRLELEITLLADRLDVTEECVRLRSHLQLFREALTDDQPVGRKLNFITQEINREINTIGSKANDTRMGHIVVDMKEELEKIREQIQNIE
ncbi:MAG: YicC family protein [Rhodothermaceae bacterium]|nr:YicC family protein [Rhodothermaceae bacterium]